MQPLILLAEDDADIVAMLAELLSEMGCRVLICRDAPAAAALLAGGVVPELIVCDWHLRHGGAALVRAAMRKSGTLDRPFIVLTGDVSVNAVDGVESLLYKPFDLDELMSAVTKALRSMPMAAIPHAHLAATLDA